MSPLTDDEEAERAFLAMEASQDAAEARSYAAMEESAGDWEYADIGQEDHLDRIYSEVDALLCDGRFGAVDERLRTTDVASLPVVQLLALVSITEAASDRLAERRPFLARVRQHLTEVEPHRVDALLIGFGDNDVAKGVA